MNPTWTYPFPKLTSEEIQSLYKSLRNRFFFYLMFLLRALECLPFSECHPREYKLLEPEVYFPIHILRYSSRLRQHKRTGKFTPWNEDSPALFRTDGNIKSISGELQRSITLEWKTTCPVKLPKANDLKLDFHNIWQRGFQNLNPSCQVLAIRCFLFITYPQRPSVNQTTGHFTSVSKGGVNTRTSSWHSPHLPSQDRYLLFPHQRCWVHRGPEANCMFPLCHYSHTMLKKLFTTNHSPRVLRCWQMVWFLAWFLTVDSSSFSLSMF